MARQPSGKKDVSLDDVEVTDEVDSAPASPSADSDDAPDPSDSSVESVESEVDDEEDGDDEEAVDDAVEEAGVRSAEAAELWSDVRVEPVELALPKGVGFTLRAYRMSDELAVVDVVEEEDDAFAVLNRSSAPAEDDEIEFDEEFVDERPGVHEEAAPPARARRRRGAAAESDEDEDVESDAESDDDEAAELEDESSESEPDEDDESDEDDEDDDESDDDRELTDEEIEAALAEDDDDKELTVEPAPEEVPLFLTKDGKLLLFRSPEGLVEFITSDEEHDFTQLDTWADLRSRITVDAVVPLEEDSYELDLVVENLRGGHDAWDAGLLIGAGEAARDLAYALRLEAVRTALAPGSPLDNLDEGLRDGAGGGMGGFFARRRLKKIGAQQVALGWRTIIGKISAAVDWRD